MPWLGADQGDTLDAGPHTAAELRCRVRQLEAELERTAGAGPDDGPIGDEPLGDDHPNAPDNNAPNNDAADVAPAEPPRRR